MSPDVAICGKSITIMFVLSKLLLSDMMMWYVRCVICARSDNEWWWWYSTKDPCHYV